MSSRFYFIILFYYNDRQSELTYLWTHARRPVPRPWIRSAEVRGERRYEKGTQQQQLTYG